MQGKHSRAGGLNHRPRHRRRSSGGRTSTTRKLNTKFSGHSSRRIQTLLASRRICQQGDVHGAPSFSETCRRNCRRRCCANGGRRGRAVIAAAAGEQRVGAGRSGGYSSGRYLAGRGRPPQARRSPLGTSLAPSLASLAPPLASASLAPLASPPLVTGAAVKGTPHCLASMRNCRAAQMLCLPASRHICKEGKMAMKMLFASAFAICLSLAAVSASAAMPLAPLDPAVSTDTIRVAGGCGRHSHRLRAGLHPRRNHWL